MPRYQIEVDLEASGYVEVEAVDKTAAKKALREAEPRIQWSMFSDVDTEMMEETLNMRIGKVEVVEPE